MIVDTSALMAVVRREEGYEAIGLALASEAGLIPAPVIVEFRRVTEGRDRHLSPLAQAILAEALGGTVGVEAFTADDAAMASDAVPIWGRGNEAGGTLNFGDLMVYALARRTGRPILCTGKDFAQTDAHLHPASRRD